MNFDKILFIAPLPPPITGQAVASQTLLDAMVNVHKVEVINYAKSNFKQGIKSSFCRIFEIFSLIGKVLKKRHSCNKVYFTITQSVLGNIRDMILMYLLRKKYLVIHLHGGGIKKTVFEKSRLLKHFNRWMLKYVNRIVVLGNSLKKQYEGMVSKEKLVVVANSVPDELFLDVKQKTRKKKKQMLFLSNLIPGKGYLELVEAIKSLNTKARDEFDFIFAGGFESEDSRKHFLDSIVGIENISYRGIVSGEAKKQLLFESDYFCLPTYYPYEGQPISILEAYAAGCVVITTYHNGIVDVFTDGDNGFVVTKKSVESLRDIINSVASFDQSVINKISIENVKYARRNFSKQQFCNSLLDLFKNND